MSRQFNGSSDHAKNSSPIFPTGANPFTVAFWCLPNTNGSGYGTPVSWGKTGTNNALIIAQDGGALNNAITVGSYGANVLTSSNQMTQSQWNTVFLTYDGSTLAIYINGTSGGTATVTLSTSSAAGSELWIGDLVQGGQPFNGFIGEIVCWNTALTANDALAFQHGVFPNYYSGLVAYYPLWGTGASEPDLSGNANNLTLTGTSQGNHAPTMSFTESFPGGLATTPATMVTDDELGTLTLNATLGVGNWGLIELGQIESNFHSTASAVGITAVIGTGILVPPPLELPFGYGIFQDGGSTASGVGVTVIFGTGSASGVSTASGVGASLAAGVGSASGTSSSSGVSGDIGSAGGDSSAIGVGASLAAGVGSAGGDSSAIGVGASLAAGVGSASGDSTASAVGDYIIAGSAGTVAGTSTASGVGASVVRSVGTGAGTSTDSGVGASVVRSVGTGAGTSTASAIGVDVDMSAGGANGVSTASGIGASLAKTAGTAAGNSTAAAISKIAVFVSGISSAEAFGTPTLISHAYISPSGISSREAFGNLTVNLFILPTGIISEESVGVPIAVGHAIFVSAINEEGIGTPTIVRAVVPEVKKFIFDAVGSFDVDGEFDTSADDYGVLNQNIIFSGKILAAEIVDLHVPKKKKLTERVQLIKVVDGNSDVFFPDVLEVKHNLDKIKPLSNFFKTNNIIFPGVTQIGSVRRDFIKLIYSTAGKEWRSTLHYSGRSTVDNTQSEDWVIDISFGSSGRSWKFTTKLTRTRGQLVETSRIIAFYKNKNVVNKNDSFFGFVFTINPTLLQSKPDVVQPIVLSDAPGFFRNLQQLAFRIYPQNTGIGSHQFFADNTLAYDATLTGGVR
jgi:hypothetical protein